MTDEQAAVTKTKVEDAIILLRDVLDSQDYDAYPDEKMVITSVVEDLEKYVIGGIENRQVYDHDEMDELPTIPDYHSDKYTGNGEKI